MEHRKEEADESVTVTHKWELINKNKPVWLRPAAEVTHEEYAELYKWLAGDWEDHLAVNHVVHSGQVEFKALLYCPRSAPKDMFDMGKMAQRFSIRLYVRRVFIKEFNDLIPKWMGFIKGIVDSDDMPLNISREKLQQNAILKHIVTGLQKNAFKMFEDIAKDKDRYKVFYEAFSQCLKLGVYEDHANRSQIIPLLRYHSSKSGDDLVSLDEYVERMKPGQQFILYITGRNRRDASRSPYIEGLRKDGYEVLYMVDPVDEYAVQFLKEFKGFDLMCCTSSHVGQLLNMGRTKEDLQAELEPLRKRLVKSLGKKVERIGFAADIEPEACARLVSKDDGASVLELNVKHSYLQELANRGPRDDDDDLAEAVYQAASVYGFESEDPRRADVCTYFQDLIQRYSVGEADTCADEWPCPASETPVRVVDLGGAAKATTEDAVWPSCGSIVRVTREDRTRRAIISITDDDSKTVDVIYPHWSGKEEEEDNVPLKKVQKLMPFETDAEARAQEPELFRQSLYKTASNVKEQGNQLFKLKDFEAAHERYAAIVAAFAARPVSRGQCVLVAATGTTRELRAQSVVGVDAEGLCELADGREVPVADVLPVVSELLPLHTAAYMNRARCRQNLGMHQEAAQDLTAVLGLWAAADKRMMEADPEMKEAEAKGQYTALYLRAKSRLARGLARQAAADVKAALAREPPAPMAKQLKQLKAEVVAAQEEHRRVNGPLAKELAKLVISIRGGPKIS
eukprot:TRINITY_DN3805_c0_g1_i5.p1 TRINITY_DN3805_c0_g1~~TRINITY_DN3805_c0_g1_i5.p1  ORF type:complete len:740 (-),score=149.65 TRINITY_DN3805_c0_g1_i5:214-2433(-)